VGHSLQPLSFVWNNKGDKPRFFYRCPSIRPFPISKTLANRL
jgi:hypothetical protein